MHRLALSLGCTVAELGNRMSSRELTEWIAYYDYEPWGSYIDGYRHAVTASAAVNAGLMTANPKMLRDKAFKPEQFGVGLRDMNEPKGSTITKDKKWEEQKAMLNRVIGGKC